MLFRSRFKITMAAVAEWYGIVAGFVTSSSPVPLKSCQRCTLNLSRAEMLSRCRPRHLTMVQNSWFAKSPRVAEQCDVNLHSSLKITMYIPDRKSV
ncbi:hypothetical protein TNCV_3039881 [Trichonephila clavipes]|uniref:Uncharacterized protein n=1 Tax=Trichonephila clavipes TaxID=2585209 RepID=A0A8X6V9M2_TRICX|nr:hypothetical protein TNCV_3039881 [Trichonephila clavipes]